MSPTSRSSHWFRLIFSHLPTWITELSLTSPGASLWAPSVSNKVFWFLVVNPRKTVPPPTFNQLFKHTRARFLLTLSRPLIRQSVVYLQWVVLHLNLTRSLCSHLLELMLLLQRSNWDRKQAGLRRTCSTSKVKLMLDGDDEVCQKLPPKEFPINRKKKIQPWRQFSSTVPLNCCRRRRCNEPTQRR